MKNRPRAMLGHIVNYLKLNSDLYLKLGIYGAPVALHAKRWGRTHNSIQSNNVIFIIFFSFSVHSWYVFSDKVLLYDCFISFVYLFFLFFLMCLFACTKIGVHGNLISFENHRNRNKPSRRPGDVKVAKILFYVPMDAINNVNMSHFIYLTDI